MDHVVVLFHKLQEHLPNVEVFHTMILLIQVDVFVVHTKIKNNDIRQMFDIWKGTEWKKKKEKKIILTLRIPIAASGCWSWLLIEIRDSIVEAEELVRYSSWNFFFKKWIWKNDLRTKEKKKKKKKKKITSL